MQLVGIFVFWTLRRWLVIDGLWDVEYMLLDEIRNNVADPSFLIYPNLHAEWGPKSLASTTLRDAAMQSLRPKAVDTLRF